MRHRPARPPLTARLVGGLIGSAQLLRRLLRGTVRQQGARMLLGAAVVLAVTAIVLTIPVVSGTSDDRSGVALDASSTAARQADGSSPVVMGADGAPLVSAAPDTTGSRAARSSSKAAGGGTATGSGSGTSSTTGSPGSSSRLTLPGSSSSGSSSSGSSASSATETTGGDSDTPSSPQSTSDGPSAPPAPDPVGELLSLVNAQRATAGCGALAVDDTLTAAAQAHSAAMRDEGFVGLVDPVSGSVLDRGARAATVAHGSADPATVLAGWLADPVNRAAILDCSLTSVGIGTADGDTGPWWTQLLA